MLMQVKRHDLVGKRARLKEHIERVRSLPDFEHYDLSGAERELAKLEAELAQLGGNEQ
jgi:hypothetical protein